MDCPSEERLIRMKLEGMAGIQSLEFDLPGRRLDVCHENGVDSLLFALASLNLETKLVSSFPVAGPAGSQGSRLERRVLWQVLAVNCSFFILEILAGFIADSMGLVADSLDMLADSIVYGLSLFAVGKTASLKKRIAGAAGYFQLVLALLGFTEVVRRFWGQGESPGFQLMIVVSLLALAGNATCLILLQKAKSREAHMQASMIFTSTDIIANLGVVAAGILVYLTASMVPDLVVGAVVFVLVGRGAYRILQLSK
jgi:Co/Zn/Cd efflux system component